MSDTISSIMYFLTGAFASLMPFFLSRYIQKKSIKNALQTEIDHLYEKCKIIFNELEHDENSIPDNESLKMDCSVIFSSFPMKTPVIYSCYDKIDLIDKKILRGLVKIGIYVEELNKTIEFRKENSPLSAEDIYEMKEKIFDILPKVQTLIHEVWR